MRARSGTIPRAAPLRLIAVTFLAISLPPCSGPLDSGGEGLPRGTIDISRNGNVLATYRVELAVTPEDQAKGLMNRQSMPRDEGMAFLFSTPVRGSFYMKDTLIPLDIAFWDQGGRIISIMTMTPCQADPCPTYTPDGDYVGALEVNAGVFEEKGVRVGDQVVLKEG